MPSLQDLRAKLPDLEGLDDRNAIEYIREVYYPDRTVEHLAQRLGVKPAAPPVEDAGLVSRAKDVGVSLLKSTIGVPETMVGLADIPTGGRVGKFLENEGGAIGFRPKEANAALDEMYSPAQKAANREVQQADGIVDTLGAAVANPSTIAHGALTSLGTLLAGAPLGKAALWLGTNAAQRAAIGLLPKAEQGAALSAASRTPGWAAGGLAEGGATAGQNLEQVRQETKDGLVTPEQTAIIAASGALTGVIAGVAGKVANSLGIGDINQMVAGARQAGPAVQKGLARRIAEGFATEGILQEFPQSAQEQIAQNVALGKPWDEGVGNAAVMGALSGGLIGGVAGPFHGKHPPTGGDGDSGDTGTPPPAPPQTQVPVVGTLSSAANTAIDAQAHVQIAEAAQAAPAPAALTPEHAAAVLARAGERKAELEAKAKGVPDQDVDSGKDGEKVTIKGTPGQMLTPDEKAELDVLSEHGGDAQKMSTIYATAAPTGTATAAEAPDELLDAARDYVREAGKISPSGIQKHLRIGYERAQRLVEALKEEAKPKAAPKITPAMLARKGLAIPGAISPEAALDRTHRAAATDEAIQRATGREGEPPPAPPAPPKIPPPTAEHTSDTEPPHLPTDMLHPTKGVPYTLRGAAVRAQKSLPNPDAVVIASVKGGYVLRPVAAPAKPKESPNVQPPAAAATSGVEGVAPTVDEAAHAAATSPENELPQPTPAQKEAGNYAKGHVKVAGLDVSIENPAGSVRSGVDKGGKAWSNTLQHHYGYVKGTVGNDKDHFDVFIKPGTTEDHAGPVFVIDQYHDNGGGAFDEHKGLIGFSDIEEAKAAYLSNYAKGWRGMRAISTMPMGEFKTWVRDGEKNKPLVPFSTAKGPATSAPGTALAKNLTVTFGGKTYPVSSVEDARDKWEQFRDQSAGGVSVIGNGVRVLDGAGKFVGRVSYNGRIWHEEDGLGSKGEKAPVASAQALPAQASPNPPSAAAPAPGDAPARARLEKVAERLGVKVFKAAGGFHATGDSVDIPDDDVQVQSAVSPLHVFAHELGHAVMHKRGLSFKGFPKTEVLKRIENYDELIAASKAYRPGVHGHENPRYRRHAMTPNEVIADAIGSVLIGQSDIALLQPMMKSMGLTERDLGLADAPAAKPVTVTKAGAGATAIVIDPSAGRPASSANTIFTEDAAAAARARLKAKLGRLQSGLDPETIMDGITLAGYHIEKGARTFAAYARAMVDDLGEAVKPYLQSWYMAVRSDPRAAGFKADMDKASVVEDLDVDAVLAEKTDPAPVEKPPATDDTGEDHAAPTLDQPGARALEGVPAEPGSKPGAKRDAGRGSDAGGGTDEPGSVDADRSGVQPGTGVRAGPAGIPVSPAGDSGGAGAGADAGVSGSAEQPAADAGVQRDLTPQPQPDVARTDYRITDATRLGEGGQKTKFKNNVEAIRLINDLDATGRLATPAEQDILARYVGWGGLAQAFDPDNAAWAKEHAELKALLTQEEWDAAYVSTQYAHYTSEQIIGDGIYAALRRMGFRGGRMLEPGAGTGNFIGLMPEDMHRDSRVTLIERERIAARIAKYLYPEQNVQQADFADFKGNDDYFDGVTGNPPFSSTPLTDTSDRKHLSGLSVHNYFFAKSVDMLRPGGILAQVVSNSFLDAGRDRARRYIGARTRLLGAIRLPNNAFSKNANTEVTTDLIFLQKLPESEWNTKATKAASAQWADQVAVPDPDGGEDIEINRYFAEHPEMMLGEMGRKGTMYRADQPALVARPGQDTTALLREAVARLPENVYVAPAVVGTERVESNALRRMENPGVEVGGYFERAGRLYQRAADEAGESMATELTPATQWTAKTTLGQARFDRLKELAALRLTLRGLIAAEMAGRDAGPLRATLNKQYDAYVKENGYINDVSTQQLLDDDPDYPLLASLEHDYKRGMGVAAAKSQGIKPFKSTAAKSPIFTRAVVAPRSAVVKAETPADALAVSMAERGRIDPDYMAELLGKNADEILHELSEGAKPLLFMDPSTGQYVLRDAYLSGNVRAKLAAAKDAGMMAHVRELTEVLPEDVGASGVGLRIGAPWVPPAVYEDFVRELLGDEAEVKITYVPLTGGFLTSIRGGNQVASRVTWGTPKASTADLIDALLNNRAIKITYVDDGKTYTDKVATEAANLKASEIKEKLQDWAFKDADRGAVLVRAYNDANNNYVTRVYDGSMMSFPGKVPDEIIKFRRHQRNAIARIVQDRTTLLDHVVGAGKTYTVVAGMMELKRTGLARKPMIVVPNHLVKQWASDFYRLYPGANILAATKKDFEGPNRRRFLARIATGDWDSVILAHSSFGFIAPSPEFEEAFNEKQVADVMATIAAVQADGDPKDPKTKRRVKQLAKLKESLEQRIKALRNRPIDALLDFGQLGVDQLSVDEAHLFKNLMFSTKMQGVSGLGDGTGSQRAYDMYVKTHQIMAANGRGQGVVFATGTPISNTLAEMYHMQRYLMPDAMVAGGFQSFDAWANTFASVDPVWMQKISGDGFKVQNRMASFVNVPELLKMFDQVSDTVTMEDIKKAYSEENDGAEFPLPKLKTGRRQPVSLVKSAAQTAYMLDIAARAQILEARRGPPQKGDDNHLSLMSDARKAAMDIRLVDYDLTEREPGGRIDRASDEVVERYKKFDQWKGTQVVFSDLGTPKKHAAAELKEWQALKARADLLEDEDLVADMQLGNKEAAAKLADAQDAADELEAKGPDWLDAVKAALRGFSVYDDFKAALIEKGIPANEIAFIHDYNTDDQKAALFKKVNAGQIRVLMGSTAKLGAGTNMQERIVGLHHLDVPWKPSDVEQREGRIIRQGNKLMDEIKDFEVEILAYVTQDTLDMRMWQIQEAKLKMINQLRTRSVDREIENPFEDMEMSAGEMQAAATGNIDLLLEIQLRTAVKKLEQKARAFDAQRTDLFNRRAAANKAMADAPKRIAQLKPWAEAAEAHSKAMSEPLPVDLTINGTKYTDRRAAQDELVRLTAEQTSAVDAREIALAEIGKAAWQTARDEYMAAGNKDGLVAGVAAAAQQEAINAAKKTHPMPRLAVEFEGKTYGSKAALADAFHEAAGDANRIDWTFDGKTYHSRSKIAGAIGREVVEALETDTLREIGSFGPYTVAVEGSRDRFGERYLDIQLKMGRDTYSNPIRVSRNGVIATDAPLDALNAATRLASSATSELQYANESLARAQKQIKDLDATATPDAEWPGAAELEKARAAHKEVLARLAAPKVAAPVVAPGSTNLAQTGAPEANEADVLYSLNFDDLGSEDYLSHDEYWGKQAVPRVQAHRRLTKLTEALKSGAISQEEFNDGVDVLAMRLGTVAATKQANRLMSERKRGVRRARIKLNEAVEQGDLDADTADFALWALEKNPALATDLSFSFRKSTDSTPAGDYNPAAQIVRVFKGGSKSDTAVHEILHHAERMMPEDVQDAIRKEWAKAVGKALKEAAKDPNPMVLEALNDLLVAKPGTEAWNRIVKAFKGGILDYRKHYQLTNASEWWAVNGASILQARYEADGWVAKARQWLKEMIEHLKAMFGGASHAAVLRGLESVLGATGERLSPEMLNQNDAPAASLGFRDVLNAGTDRLRATRLPAGRLVGDYLEKSGKLHWWHKTVGTMHHLAKLHPTTFGRVYNAVQDFLNDVSSYATEAADLAPNILPKLETWKDIGKSPMSAADTKAVSKATFDGTLKWVRDENGQARKRDELQEEMADIEIDDKAHKLLRAGDIAPEILRMWQGLPMEQYEKIIEGKFEKRFLSAGVVFTPAELKEHFGLTGARKADGTYSGQIGLYQESRASIDNSLKNLGLSQMLRSGGKDVEGFEQAAMGMSLFDASQMLRDHLFEMAEAEPDRADELNAKGNQMVEIAERAIKLQEQGYAPLSRFGTYTLDATVDGEHFFSLYESKADRAKAVRMLRAAGATDMRSGVLSKEEYKLLDGITPETAAIFGEMLGLESQGSEAKDLAYQEFLRKAIANQSAMKRLIHRKGIAGYSEDVGRVLAGFVYSNARQISRNLHAGEIDNAVADIPQGQGDLKDAAVQLREYVKNPQEEAAWIRGLLFAQYLGGSVASAIVNMTQPLAITFPYLSQYGGAVAAGKRVAEATADALKAKTGDDELDAALKHAEAEGIVSPQEVHQLQAQAMGKAALRPGDGTAFGTAGAAVANTQTRVALAWGKVFGVAEQFNRRITFIAAYRTAVAQGIENPAKFAKKTVEDTQFTYNKGSKPKWARGAIGSTAFTFKQYSINYVELLHRMWVHGGPEGKRAALLALAVLFVLSGADGLPFEADIEDVIDGALQRMGYNFQTKQAKMEFLTRVLGSDGAARIVAKGLSGLPGAPLDVSGRLGMGNLVPGTGLFTKKDDHTSDVLELAGPVSDLIKRAATATGQVLTGQVGKGLTTAAPKAASNVVKAFQMDGKGFYAEDSGKKVIDTTTGEAVLKGIGFQPNTVSRVQDATRQAQIMISQAKMRESEIADQWAVAKFERDPEKVQAAKDALARWNRDNPTSRITITVPQINKRVNAMRQTKAQRIEKTAPKEIRAMVRRELAGADQ